MNGSEYKRMQDEVVTTKENEAELFKKYKRDPRSVDVSEQKRILLEKRKLLES